MSKKFKKFLKSELAKIDARINVLEANLSRLVLAAVEAVAPQLLEEEKPAKKKRKKDKEKETTTETPSSSEQAPQTETATSAESASEETTEKKPRRRRRTAEEIAAEKAAAEEAKKQAEKSEETAEKKPRRRRTAEEIAAERAAAELSADDLRHLEGIGGVYADKLKAQGINTLQDMANISEERVDEIETVIKGFKKRMETNNWRGQANDLLAK